MEPNGLNIIRLRLIDSTNQYALRELPKLADKTVIIADAQTAGKGQFGKTWFSANRENIYLSLVLKPDIPADRLDPLFTRYLAQVTAAILNEYLNAAPSGSEPAHRITIKPPNDILVNGGKIAGILAETSRQGKKLNGIVLGIGINLALTAAELQQISQPATSLKTLTGKSVRKKPFIARLLREFFKNYPDFLLE